MATKTLTQADFDAYEAQCNGTENWYKHALNPKVTYTDGVKYVAEAGGAYWLIDEIALAQRFNKAVKLEEFQVWFLRVDNDQAGPRGATLSCEDGNDNVVYSKAIAYTDFPLRELKLYVENSCICLPGER